MSLIIAGVDIATADGVKKNKDIFIENGIIKDIGEDLQKNGVRVINAKNKVALPGFFDMHCHLRDPGHTKKEDITTGLRSAAAGGFTDICCMPNTNPPIDDERIINYIKRKAEAENTVKVWPVAAITKGLNGKKLTNFEELSDAGAIAFSDDGYPIMDGLLLRSALTQARDSGMLLMLHEENLELKGDGVVHAGKNARRAGLSGIPREVEDTMTARDVAYAAAIGASAHICHVSTKGSVDAVRRAKAAGANVTCETAPHYFSLTDEEILNGNPNAKMNPPLREEIDKMAIIEGIVDGTIDIIATDHAPHSANEKAAGIKRAPFGIIGFETAFSLIVTYLLKPKYIGMPDIARLLSLAPRKRLGITGGNLRVGDTADIVLCDTDEPYVYERKNIISKSKNSPFIGRELFGRVHMTIAEGKIIYDRSAD